MANRLTVVAVFLCGVELSAAELILVDEKSDAHALVPSVENGGSSLGESWKNVTDPVNIADWQAGVTGIGYDTSNGDRYRPLIGIDVEQMREEVGSVFARVPFQASVVDLATINTLTLRMKYDDGFVAWINGVRVASSNAPAGLPGWNATASSGHSDNDAEIFEPFDLSNSIGVLREGQNMLAIQGLNDGTSSSDLILMPQLVADNIQWPVLQATTVAAGLERPVDIQHCGDGSGRLFVLEKPGRVRIIKGGTLLAAPFLDIESGVDDSSNEEGLLGIAFPPGFATDPEPHFYLCYTGTKGSTLSRFMVDAANPDLALVTSEEVIMTQSQPFSNHNGGQIQFGSDGHLYVALGDGGSGNDPGDRAQNRGLKLGKILRIDVEGVPDPGKGYAIPADNPFVGDASTLDEIWALGLRNPWRFSFDRDTGDLWIADVGQGALEEINFQPAASAGGENYGWRYFEGFRVNNTTGIVPGSPVAPVHQYGRSFGRSITGGYVYRGAKHPRMQGVYFYVDYYTGDFTGIQSDGAQDWSVKSLLPGVTSVTTFGEDEAGELYFATDSSGSSPNRVFRISDIRDTSYLKVLSVEFGADGRLSLVFGSEIGESYQLQVSEDLAEWNGLGAPGQAGGYTHGFTEPVGSAPGSERFLRVVPLD
ncbi:MAG: PQQ-dependent sugar dehydrogenase [Verrucomicrobiales bacterium]